MADLLMPKLGLTMEEGTVVRWLARAGERLQQGQPVLEIRTDKVTVEVEAPADGVLGSLLIAEGETVPIGSLLARIETGEGQAEKPTKVTPLARRIATTRGIDLSATQEGKRVTAADVLAMPALPQRLFSSPRARKRAREAGIEWRDVEGSGPHGRVIERDVLSRTEQSTCAQSGATPGAEVEARGAAEAETCAGSEKVSWLVPSPIQQLTAERTAAAFASAPHFYLTAEADAEALVELRERLMPAVERKTGARLTLTDLLVRALASALAEHRLARGFWESGRIGVREEINVGIATATEAGLVVPVIKIADRLPLSALARERQRLVRGAREGRLAPDDLAGGIATLTNLGNHRVDQFQPVLNSPQSVILATGRIASRPFVAGGQLLIRHTVFLTLACDHRVLDGEAAARFLDCLVRHVEEPFELLV